jgi:hypothetical protein
MPSGPAHADPASEPGDPLPSADWMTAADWEAWCDATAVDDEPPASGDDEDEAPNPGSGPGEWADGASGFAAGGVLDALPGGGTLTFFAELAAGEDNRYADVSDDELDGVIAGWGRSEAYACARKHAAVAEFIRRRAEPDCGTDEQSGMPAVWDEFAVDELRLLFAENRGAAEDLMSRAHDLAVKLPETMALFLAGRLPESRVKIIVYATAPLDPAEARAAEALVLGRAGRLTPGGLRAAIARAVMEVAPKKARKRREVAAKFARVERWAEDSGNAALAGRELPPEQVFAVDQRITAWAGELKKAGLEGGIDELRARAMLDLLLGQDSRPGQDSAAAPAGFAGRVNLTVPLATLTRLADRPGEIPGIGPIDPWLARDLAAAAAANPTTTWCVTVTDEHGHAIGHGCARPGPKRHRKRAGPGTRDGPGFAFVPEEGAWRLRTPGGGPDLLVALDPIDTGPCDHRFQAKGHDPGVKLKHLTQVRNTTCTGPWCRRPSTRADFEHNTPHEAGGRTCLCNGGPKCRRDHRLKQDPRWKVDQLPDGTFRWITPTGRQYTTEPTRYPV